MSIATDPQMQMHMSGLRKQVEDWPRRRWGFLAIGLVCLVTGVFNSCRDMPVLWARHSLLEKLEIDQRPENLSVEWWLLAEVRRSMSYFEHRNHEIALALIESVIGILIAGSSLIIMVPLAMHWRHGGMEVQNSRLLLMLYDELQGQHDTNAGQKAI